MGIWEADREERTQLGPEDEQEEASVCGRGGGSLGKRLSQAGETQAQGL